MNCVAVGRDCLCAGIATFHLSDGLLFRHAWWNSEIHAVSGLMRAVTGFRQPLGNKRHLMLRRSVAAGRREAELFQRRDRVKALTESRHQRYRWRLLRPRKTNLAEARR